MRRSRPFIPVDLGRRADSADGPWPAGDECSPIGWFRSAFDAGSVRKGFRVPKEGVQKCPPNFGKCGPIVMKFCTMVDEALGCL